MSGENENNLPTIKDSVTTSQLTKKERKKLEKKQKRKLKRQQEAEEKKKLSSDPLFISSIKLDEQLRALEEEQELAKMEEEEKKWRQIEEEFQASLAEKQEKQEKQEKKNSQKETQTMSNTEKKKNLQNDKVEKEITVKSDSLTTENNGVEYSFGTEKDAQNCAFYLKTGSCRYGDRCGKHHLYPIRSPTILFKNMYDHGIGMSEVLDEDADDDLQYDESEIIKHFEEFYNDIKPELERHGEIVQLKICRNHASHLKGNVYVQYKDVDSAVKAFAALNGRYYAAKKLTPEFVPVTNWKSAVCGLYHRRQCPRGKECNFLHVFRNPGGEFPLHDRDERRRERSTERERRRYRSRSRSRSSERHKHRKRDKSRERDRSSHRSHRRSKDRSRDRSRSRERSRRKRHRSRSRSRDRSHRHEKDVKDKI